MALIPLESNPDVMTKLIHILGVPDKWFITDVYGLDVDLLAVVPRPVLAMILLYPMSDKTESFTASLENKPFDKEKIKNDGVYHIKQLVSNACGTIALIHSIANNLDKINLKDGFAKKFLEKTKDLDYEQRGELLCKSEEIIDAHKDLSHEGQTEANPDQPSYHHFIALIEKNGTLYELDGRKTHPIDHGATSADNFLTDAARVCHEYMESDPDDLRFTMVALVGND